MGRSRIDRRIMRRVVLDEKVEVFDPEQNYEFYSNR